MQHRKLAKTDISVSNICLGTMTYGRDLDDAAAFAQMDYALDHDVNFFDVAEMYPVPTSPDDQGASEATLGRWFAKTGRRDEVVLATKVVGPGDMSKQHLGRDFAFSRSSIKDAVEQSLKRLQTDYIDLYQLHWPDRHTNCFGRLNYAHKPEQDGAQLEESLAALTELVAEGKLRAIGLSNETPWGLMKSLNLSETKGMARVASVQNPFNLLNRTAEVGLAEVMHREEVSFLPYSPLAFGVFSGKYFGGARPEGARMTRYPVFARYFTENGIKATEAYHALAKAHGIDPCMMALAWVNQHPVVTSNIIGASTMAQLEMDIASAEVVLSDELLSAIDEIHTRLPNPCP
ncbi:MAG: aldo/keto reductase [Pontibacterium sp.]